MRVLYISDILLTGDFVLSLQNEGCEVKLFIEDERCQNYLDTLVEKTKNWKKELDWVGKDGLIIFDDVGYGKEQDDLRKKGYTVFGGSELADKAEMDRDYGNSLFKKYGLNALPLISFKVADDAIAYVKKHPEAWVLKYSGAHNLKTFAYIGEKKDGSDIIAVLENYKRFKINQQEIITLQRRVFGIEIGVARYFNGNDWVGPVEYNIEHTHFFPGDTGPTVDEMGTLAWCGDDETEKLYAEVLAPLKPFLKRANFRGDFDVNCIVNESGAYPLEVTSRLGSPIIHAQEEMQLNSWSAFLFSVAKGDTPTVTWREGFSIVVSLCIPPFPYPHIDYGKVMLGADIHIDASVIKSKLKHVHFDEIASRDGTFNNLFIAGTWGNPMYVSGFGKTVSTARRQAYGMIEKIYIPRMFFRNDIGRKFVTEDCEKLKSWGYLKGLNGKI